MNLTFRGILKCLGLRASGGPAGPMDGVASGLGDPSLRTGGAPPWPVSYRYRRGAEFRSISEFRRLTESRGISELAEINGVSEIRGIRSISESLPVPETDKYTGARLHVERLYFFFVVSFGDPSLVLDSREKYRNIIRILLAEY